MRLFWSIGGLILLIVLLFDSDMRVMAIGGVVGLGLLVGSQVLIEKIFKQDPMKQASTFQLLVQILATVAVVAFTFGVVIPAVK